MAQHEVTETAMDISFSDLQEQLQSALQLATEYKAENGTLRRDLEDARAFSAATLQRHSEWRESWKREVDVVSKREKELEKEESKLKIKLEEYRTDLEQMEKRRCGTITSGVQVDYVKQLESEYSSKINRLTEEVTKWREQFYESRKVCEQLQARRDEWQSQVHREREISAALQKETSLLQEALVTYIEENSHKSGNSHANMDDRVRDLKHQIENRDLLVENLRNDMRIMEKARDDSFIAKDELLSLHQAEINKISKELVDISGHNKTLQRRIESTERELEQATVYNAEMTEEMVAVKKDMERLRDSLKINEENHATETQKLRQERIESEAVLIRQLSSSKSLLVEEQSKSKELERRCIEMHDHAMKRIHELVEELDKQDNTKEKLFMAEDQAQKLDYALKSLYDEKMQNERDYHAEYDRLQHTIEMCREELKLALLEKDEMVKLNNDEKVRSDALIKELEQQKGSLVSLDEKFHLLHMERVQLSNSVEELKYENQELQRKLECAIDELKVTSTEAGVVRDQAVRNCQDANKELQSEIEKMRELLSKEKRRSEAYKGKALEAHRRSIKTKEVLDSICHRNE